MRIGERFGYISFESCTNFISAIPSHMMSVLALLHENVDTFRKSWAGRITYAPESVESVVPEPVVVVQEYSGEAKPVIPLLQQIGPTFPDSSRHTVMIACIQALLSSLIIRRAIWPLGVMRSKEQTASTVIDELVTQFEYHGFARISTVRGKWDPEQVMEYFLGKFNLSVVLYSYWISEVGSKGETKNLPLHFDRKLPQLLTISIRGRAEVAGIENLEFKHIVLTPSVRIYSYLLRAVIVMDDKECKYLTLIPQRDNPHLFEEIRGYTQEQLRVMSQRQGVFFIYSQDLF